MPHQVPTLAPTIRRHPELVSGSIARLAQVWLDESDLAARFRIVAPTGLGEKWTLKQVQGDGHFEHLGRVES